MIRINEEYVIIGNDRDLSLAIDTHSVDKQGKAVYKNLAFVRDVPSALRFLYDHLTRKCVIENDIGLAQAKIEFEKIASELKSFYSTYGLDMQ